jgi:hypothetical protein
MLAFAEREHQSEFRDAIKAEFDSLMSLGVFSAPMDLPPGHKALGTKLVLRIKDPEAPGAPPRFKARLVGKGFLQVADKDYHSTYAPVAAFNSLRVLLHVLAVGDYEIDAIDVKTAFLHAPLQEEIYINVPEHYPNPVEGGGKVLRLLKSLYGLKQAPRDWHQLLHGHLLAFGLAPTKSEPCIYTGIVHGAPCFVLLYVDDMLVCAPTRDGQAAIKRHIFHKFPCTDRGPLNIFLGITCTRDRQRRTIALSQASKVQDVVAAYGGQAIAKVPAHPHQPLRKDQSAVSKEDKQAMADIPYREALGRLLYLAITTRPDIATAVSMAGRFAQDPGQPHWQAVLEIVAYLKGAQGLSLVLGGVESGVQPHAFADADWGGDTDTRRSRTGSALFINRACVCWASRLQPTVALSSTEAEYLALTATAQDVLWLRNLLGELGHEQHGPTIIYQDNLSTITTASNPKQHRGTKHIDVRAHFIRDVIEGRKVRLEYKGTGDMIADIFTKALPHPAFARHRAGLGMCTSK